MHTSVIGFPRIGAGRELKFACEKYFRKEIGATQLLETGEALRKAHWSAQKDAGIDYIPSNDFSFYDTVLDTAVLLNIVPRRYKELELSGLDRYFAMARGYQGERGDVRALAMRKWFNTNYHYIVPELDDDTAIELSGSKPWDEYAQAKALGMETKPVVIGPYTMLRLCRYTGKKAAADYAEAIAQAYRDVIGKCEENQVLWVQFDEPALVHDMGAEDMALFRRIYDTVLPAAKKSRVLLQTYFGDARDVYLDLVAMPFAGLGLDFVEGKETRRLIEEHGFPSDKLLFAGLVNGKNVWRNRYQDTLECLGGLRDKGIQLVLSTSCSLLHVPYSLEQETGLSREQRSYLAFAREKLVELNELGALADAGDCYEREAYRRNRELFARSRECGNDQVGGRLSQLAEDDCVRMPPRKERRALQKRLLGLPELPTTTIGSFPQTGDVQARRLAFRRGQISEQEYVEFIRGKIAACVGWQEEMGLDVLVHGEYERNDMVEYFGEALGGFLFTERAWVQSYGTRCVKPPIVWGDVYRKEPITVEWSAYAQSLTQKIMKGMLTGPVTILNWSFPREDISIKESVLQIALAIRDEVLDLEARGIRVIQIDEAALREKLPLRRSDWYAEYLDFAIPAFRLTHSGVRPETQIHTHMCYSEFTDIIATIDQMDADVITFEASRSDLQLLDSLLKNDFQTEVGPGVYDIHSPRVPSVDEIVGSLSLMLARIGRDSLWVNPDCGLKTRAMPETEASLRNMVAAARRVRGQA